MSLNKTYRYNFSSFILSLVIIELIFGSIVLLFWLYLSENEPSFRFEHPKVLYFGAVILPLLMSYHIYIKWWRNKTINRYADDRLLPFLTKGFSTPKAIIKYFLLRFGLASLIVAAANPQYGEKEREVITKGVDIMIALDVSYSMNAEDLVEGKSRLEIAKKNISKLIDQLHGDQIGLVIFAGDAYKQLPITPDYNVAKMFLDFVEPDLISSQGTDIGAALEKCAESFDPEDPTQKVIVVFSDGEDHESAGIQMANAIREENIVVHTIGMGTTNGVPIPMYKNGKKIGFKTDQSGTTVLTKLNEDILIDIANAGGGSYTRAQGYNVGLDALIDQLSGMEKSEHNKDKYMTYADHFQIFLLIGLVLVLLDTFLSERKGFNFSFKQIEG
ncbi:MAG: VWA domain-containing protein [Flavobacteriales bacterium]|nr:VWA domain-containing protein [Flavobacteriales bacterium]MCB9196348.1 VWA domain-containing protein [Flavobacteriales bacterium]